MYSLREVFGLVDAGPSRTQSLMESYGLKSDQVTLDEQPQSSVTDIIREAIETGKIPQLDEPTLTSAGHGAQRDDITLQRWREMAGLDNERGS